VAATIANASIAHADKQQQMMVECTTARPLNVFIPEPPTERAFGSADTGLFGGIVLTAAIEVARPAGPQFWLSNHLLKHEQTQMNATARIISPPIKITWPIDKHPAAVL